MNSFVFDRTQLAAQAGRTIAVASGKGGVGKTWLSITLSHLLARRGARVLLLDADPGLANIDIQLGLTPARDLSDVAAGRVDLLEAVIDYTGPDGSDRPFSILPGRSGLSVLGRMPLPELDAMLARLRDLQAYDTVLLDLGAGIDRMTRRLAAWADTLLVVTTDEPTAIADAYAVLKLHVRDHWALRQGAGPEPDVRVVINQAATLSSGERAFTSLTKACSTFLGTTPALCGIIRRDPNVGEAVRRQTMLAIRHPNTQALEEVHRVARALRQ